MSAIIIERAQLPDAAAILSLQQLAYLEEAKIYNDYNIPPLRQTLAELQADFARQLVLKAVSNLDPSGTQKIIGSVRAYLQADTVYIGRLIVDPTSQNQGLGSRLMQAIEREFNTATRFELFTGAKSERNLYLYKKLGYQIFKSQPIDHNLTLVYLEKLNK